MQKPLTSDIEHIIKNLFSDLEVRNVRLLGEGWTCFVYLINNKIVFKIPQNQDMAHCIENELACLTEIKNLPIEIPRILYQGIMPNGLPIIGESKIEGHPLTEELFYYLGGLGIDGDKWASAGQFG
ncbi:MAG: hypothetical protein PHX68_04685 [Alphaproteobacteria bacterium]|nr:hypothetical protein [Alphaproteobacteria bacterium]